MTSNMTMTAISICDFLKLIVKSTVKHYTEDFKLDIKIFKRYAKEAQETGKAVPMLWFCRYNGTYLCLEEDAYKVGTSMFNTFKYYDENMEDEARTIKAFLVTVTGMEERKPIGCITPINYKGECDRIRHYAVPSHNVEVIYKNGTLIQEREVFDKYPIVKHPKFGTIREAKFLADDPDALDYALHMARNERKAGYQNGNPPIDLCVNEMQVGSLTMPTPNIPAPVIYLYDEQGQDELDWFACTSFAPRASGDESSHVVFCDMSFSNAFATTDVFVNPRKGIPFVQCSTENQLSDFRKADSHE